MSDMRLGLPQFEAFLEGLNVPNSCVLNKPLFKRCFRSTPTRTLKTKRL